MPEAETTRRSRTKTLLVAVVVLLAIAVVVNWEFIRQVVSGERTAMQVVWGQMNKPGEEYGSWTLPEPAGAEDAGVTVKLFVTPSESCHVPTYCLGKALADIDPERMRIVFVDNTQAEGGQQFRELGFACMQGIAVNGNSRFTVPAMAEDADDREPSPGQSYPYDSSDATEEIILDGVGGWKLGHLHYILDQALSEAYDTGLSLSPSEFDAHVKQTRDACTEELRQKADSSADAPYRKEHGVGLGAREIDQ